MVAEQVAVQRPVAPGLADVYVDHAAGEESIALQLSFGSHMETVRIETVCQPRADRKASRSGLGYWATRLVGRVCIVGGARLGVRRGIRCAVACINGRV